MKRWARRTKELTDLDIPAGVEKNVVRLDVAMNDVLAVEMGKTFASLEAVSNLSRILGWQPAYLVAYSGDLCLCDMRVVIDDIGQRSTLHELHHNPQLVVALLQERI